MKSLASIFGFLFFVQIERTRAFSMMDNVIFHFNEPPKHGVHETYRHAYAVDASTIADLHNDAVAPLQTHLQAAFNGLTDHPLKSVFAYLLALSAERASLRKFNRIAENIRNFIEKSGGEKKNFLRMVNFLRRHNLVSLFVANSVCLDREHKIRAFFDEHDEQSVDAKRATEKVETAKIGAKTTITKAGPTSRREVAKETAKKSAKTSGSGIDKAAESAKKAAIRIAAAERRTAATTDVVKRNAAAKMTANKEKKPARKATATKEKTARSKGKANSRTAAGKKNSNRKGCETTSDAIKAAVVTNEHEIPTAEEKVGAEILAENEEFKSEEETSKDQAAAALDEAASREKRHEIVAEDQEKRETVETDDNAQEQTLNSAEDEFDDDVLAYD